ncbi:MAG: chemotaxis protein CheW, partial [Betaproteobacteria bacterium]
PSFGVLMQTTVTSFILAIDGFVGRDDVVIKPLHDIKPKGIAGATLSGDGLVVLVLDIEELLNMNGEETRASMFAV